MKNNALKIGELPEIRIVEINSILPHEHCSSFRMKKIRASIRNSGYLKNPLIVAKSSQFSQFILLDGTNRLVAMKDLGYNHIPVQIIDIQDPYLEISTWHHSIEGISATVFRDLGMDINQKQEDSAVCIKLTFSNGDICSVCSPPSLEDRVNRILQITSIYEGSNHTDRVSYTNLKHLCNNYPDFTVLISFSPFTREEIVELATNGIKVPGGITRVILPKRALHLNIPLSVLKSDSSLQQKNNWLQNDLKKRIQSKSIRFYREPVFIFDD